MTNAYVKVVGGCFSFEWLALILFLSTSVSINGSSYGSSYGSAILWGASIILWFMVIDLSFYVGEPTTSLSWWLLFSSVYFGIEKVLH